MSAAPTANKRTLFWAITFILPLLVLLIPTNDVFTQQQKMFLAITAWTILMFAFELVDNYIPCVIMPFLFIMTGVAPWELWPSVAGTNPFHGRLSVFSSW